MAETGSRVTREQKVQMARKALEDANAGRFNADGWAQDAVYRSPLLGEVRGREAIIAALKRQRDAFEEFSQEAHAVLADDDHVVALVNVNARSKGQDVKAQKAMRRAFWIFAVVGTISVGLGALAELADLTALLGLFNWASVGEGAIFLLLAYWTQRGSFIATALGTGLYVIDSVLLLVTGHFSIVRLLIIIALVRAVLSANLLRQQRQQAMSTIGGGDQTRVA